ncbi:hypothetical protein [Agarivorans gilvus]|uniref:hypothetical protein n=1 Tax=Agarivorans gilvus TaxID=680279 RepID=UPI0006EBF94D|nr:hypothetical protein [Agarivorans gilvus]
MQRLEVSILLRAFSIFAIVASHFGFIALTGGAFYLIALSGYNFVRFTLPKFGFSADKPESVDGIGFLQKYFRFVIKIIVPTCLYMILLYTVFGEFHWFGLFLMGNWLGPNYAHGFSYWFLDVLIQIYVLFACLLIIKPVRWQLTLAPYRFFAVATVISVLVRFLFLSQFDTSALMDRLPHLMFYMFVLGALISLSKTTTQKWLTTGILTLVCLYDLLHDFGGNVTVMYFGLLATLWVPAIPFPKLLALPITTIAMSSLFIYLCHFQARSLVQKILHDPSPAICTFFCLNRWDNCKRIMETSTSAI